jgi:hypothetical protein
VGETKPSASVFWIAQPVRVRIASRLQKLLARWRECARDAVDDQLYVRLGRRAATRFEKNTTAPFVKVRISGHEFDHVRVEPAPEMAERVAAAMEYWRDLPGLEGQALTDFLYLRLLRLL